MENRNGLVVDATTTLASGTAERDAALIMAGRSIKKAGATMGADKGYDAAEFVKQLRDQGVTPHVAQKKHSAIDGRTTRHAGYTVSIKKRKLVEEIFGWSKTIGGLRKARFVGLAKCARRPRSPSPLTTCPAWRRSLAGVCRRWWDSSVQSGRKVLKSTKKRSKKRLETGF